MATLGAFHKLIAPEVAGCPEPVMNEAVLRSCIEFCERSRAFTETVSFNTSPGIAKYSIPVSTNTSPYEVVVVWRAGGTKLWKITRDIYDISFSPTITGAPMYYYMDTGGMLVLGPTPAASEQLTLTVVVKPSYNATIVDDALLAQWAPAIASGAKARLYAQKGMAWYDPAEAALKEREFSEAVSSLVAQTNSGRSGGLLRVVMRPAA